MVFFDQIYGTSTEVKKNQKMFIFRLQTVLRQSVNGVGYVTVAIGWLGLLLTKMNFVNLPSFSVKKHHFLHFNFSRKWKKFKNSFWLIIAPSYHMAT